jgi:uncharacterized protein (TIGR02271 family)
MDTKTDRTSTQQDLTGMIGRHVYDTEGNKVGTAGTIYQSDVTGAPEWITVKTGLFGTKESFVPLNGAEADDKGLHLTVHKDQIKDAPRMEEDGHLSDAETAELYRHYGLRPGAALKSRQPGTARDAVPAPRTDAGRDAARRTPAGMNREMAAGPAPTPVGRDAAASFQARADRQAGVPSDSGDASGQSMLRSEERLHAGTETVETGRVRLRKYIVTSQERITVPIRREEVHITREPVKPGEARTDATIGEEEREIVLHEERPVVTKETVPVERISLDTETVQENREVSDTVRHEEVEIDDGTKRPRR